MSDTTIPKDSRELAEKLYSTIPQAYEDRQNLYKIDSIISLIESYVAERERIAREETARKCAEIVEIHTSGHLPTLKYMALMSLLKDAAKGEENE